MTTGLMMSIKAFKWAKEQVLPGVPKSVLICICDRYNDEFGYAWPSVKRIATDTGWSVRTVANAISYLKDEGLIETRRQYYLRDHTKGPNRYYLPRFGPVPPEGRKYPIKGDYDWAGRWDPTLEPFEYEDDEELDADR